MRTTCLINNYNYEEFVLEAVESALNQTVAFDEVIVVDDGSKDKSVELLKESYSSHPKVKLILKENRGQMSCFYEGFLASMGDIVFFLDADDLYCENYLEEALRIYRDLKCDFLFCSHKDFDEAKEKIREHYTDTVDLGYSVIFALLTDLFWPIGNVTSTLSVKRDYLNRIFPYPFMLDWRTEADRCLVMGSSISGARKAYCHKTLVKRRIHGKNLYARGFSPNKNKKADYSLNYLNLVRRQKFKNFMANKMQIDTSKIKYVSNEFMSIPNPTYQTVKLYAGLVDKANLGFFQRIRAKISIYKYWFSNSDKRVRYIAKESYISTN